VKSFRIDHKTERFASFVKRGKVFVENCSLHASKLLGFNMAAIRFLLSEEFEEVKYTIPLIL
jgi:hypothetical protein